MKAFISAAFIFVLSASLAIAKDKKKDLPIAFSTAHFVYVESVDGDITKLDAFPCEQVGILNVERVLDAWKRYTITEDRKNADLVIIVRRRRPRAQNHPGNSLPAPSDPGTSSLARNPAAVQNRGFSDVARMGDSLSATAAGPPIDELRVFVLTGNGKLKGPIWSGELQEGLDVPNVPLARALIQDIERAYPAQSPTLPASATKP